MTNKAEPKSVKLNATGGDDLEADGSPVFLLEDLYPNATALFSPALVPSADNAESLVAFDTNALLLPYNISSQDLSAFAKVLTELANAERLFVPARAAREFIKHRDRKLADMLKALRDKTSSVRLPEQKLSPLLNGVEGYMDVTVAAEALSAAWRDYRKAQDKILSKMRDWRGNDPVSLVYASVLVGNRIVEVDEDRDVLVKEWALRRINRTPPGYKDSGKSDTGIGDFLIWKTLLKLGALHKRDMIFVTGDDKADWFVRSDSERVYPRPELVDEYRRVSAGRNIRLASLAELLEEMKAPVEVVVEVRSIEKNVPPSLRGLSPEERKQRDEDNRRQMENRLKKNFGFEMIDYSTFDGRKEIYCDGLAFELRFSKGDKTSIHLIRDGGTARIARVKSTAYHKPLSLRDYDMTSSSYLISVDEAFIVENDRGDVLVGRITFISDDSRGDEDDVVEIDYLVFRSGEQLYAP
ncbi:PIN-like domain-containing protein [Allorhizobium undicola]|uniref:PIN-like domain-containing protein n=1 Tax=Allorhizobium undicola TaxID=78527 RepID=UPI003D33AB0F